MSISYIKNKASLCHINNIIQSEDMFILEFISIDHISPDLIHYLSKEYGRKLHFDLSNTPPYFKYRSKTDGLSDLKGLVEKN